MYAQLPVRWTLGSTSPGCIRDVGNLFNSVPLRIHNDGNIHFLCLLRGLDVVLNFSNHQTPLEDKEFAADTRF